MTRKKAKTSKDTKLVKCRKLTECETCGLPIVKGERYHLVEVFNIESGYLLHSEKYHTNCKVPK